MQCRSVYCHIWAEISRVMFVAVDVSINIPRTSRDMGDALSSAHTQQKALNRHYPIKVDQNIRFLSRQGIALRGDADESDGNFMQLMHLCVIDDTTINDMLKKTDKYTSPQIQNELLNMSLHILREIASSL